MLSLSPHCQDAIVILAGARLLLAVFTGCDEKWASMQALCQACPGGGRLRAARPQLPATLQASAAKHSRIHSSPLQLDCLGRFHEIAASLTGS